MKLKPETSVLTYLSSSFFVLVFFSGQQYNVLTSPVPFECSDTILSPPLSPSTSQSVYLEPDCKVLTPVPCQPRVSTPHPLIDSVASRKGTFKTVAPRPLYVPVQTMRRCSSAALVHFFGCAALARRQSSVYEPLKQP